MCPIKNIFFFTSVLLSLISGCSTPSYRQVFREKEIGNSRQFLVSKEALCKATVKALCENNFLIESEDFERGFISGKRSFHRGRKIIVLLVQSKIVAEGENMSTVYLNAMETTEVSYVADRTRFFLFIIPLPGGGGKEASSIKQQEKTVEDKKFYKNFFNAIEKEIPELTEPEEADKIIILESESAQNSTGSETVSENTTQ
jgi:hypothetical protein